MKTLFTTLMLLFVAASATLIAVRNPGYVLITREPFVLETSLAVFLLLLAAVFAVVYFLVRMLVGIMGVPRSLNRWRQTRRTRKAREAFLTGLTHLLAGEWIKAEKELVASLHATDSPFLGTLGAALAAHGQGDYDKRDNYLSQAQPQNMTDTLATEMTQAQLQLLAGQNEQALATLIRVQSDHPHQAQALRLLIEAQRRLQDWHGLAQLLPEAQRRHLLPEKDFNQIEHDSLRELLSLPLPIGSLDTLHRAWSGISAQTRRHPDLVSVYARQLIRQDAMDECIDVLATALEQHWDERLVLLFGEARGSQPAAQLETAEEWHARHGESAGLLLTLGRLARRNRQNDRALAYLEKSLALAPSAEAHAEIGQLFEASGDSARALDHCQQALTLCRHLQQPAQASAEPVGSPATTHSTSKS